MKDALFQAYGGAAFTHSSGGGLLKPGDFHGQAALLIKEHVHGDERAQQKALCRLVHPEKGNAIVRQTLTCLEREIACSQPTIPSGLKRTGGESDSDDDDQGEPSVLLHPQELSGAAVSMLPLGEGAESVFNETAVIGTTTRGVVVDEYAAIGVIELSQTHDVGAPGEDFALKAPSSLWNAIDGLLDDADHGAGRDADLLVGVGRTLR